MTDLKLLSSLALWSGLSIASLIIGLLCSVEKCQYFNLTISGLTLILFGSILSFISYKFGPKSGILAEITHDEDGNQLIEQQGSEFIKHSEKGMVILILGSIIALLSAIYESLV